MDCVTALGHGSQGAVGHTWSLAIEEQFYLLWPILLILTPRRWRLPLIIALACGSALWRYALVYRLHAPLGRAYFGFDTRAEALLWGCAIALLPNMLGTGERIPRLVGRLWIVPTVIFLAITATANHDASRDANGIGFSVTALLASWLLIAAREPGRFADALRTRPIVYIGRISYGLYLWHYPLLVIVHARSVAGNMLVVAVATGIAAASFQFIEKPILRYKRRFQGA